MNTRHVVPKSNHARRSALLALVVGMASLATVPAMTLIHSLPYVIEKRGNYALAGDLELEPDTLGAAIRIVADNVHLNLNGYSLIGNNLFGDENSVGILVEGSCESNIREISYQFHDPLPDSVVETLIRSRRQVRISGGAISGFRYGVEFRGVTQSHLNDLLIHENFRGIWMHCHSSNNHIKQNTVINQLCCGIRLDNAHSNVLVRNNSSDNGSQGLLLWRSNSNTINNNELSGNFTVGLVAYGQSRFNHIAHNSADNNNRNRFLTGGIVMGWPFAPHATATDNVIVANSAFGNDTGIVAKGDVADFHLLYHGKCANTWRGNRFGLELAGPNAGSGCIR